MEINPLLSRLMRDKKEDIMHTSGYAKTQNGERIGSASVRSFEERQRVDANRNFVQGYRNSQVGRTMKGERAQKMTPEERQLGGGTGATTGGVGQASMGLGRTSGGSRPPMRINPGIKKY